MIIDSERPHIEIPRLLSHDLVPTVSEQFPGTVPVADHNITDFLHTGDPDIIQEVEGYYASRGIQQLYGAEPGSTVYIIARNGNRQSIEAYADLYAETTGITPVPIADPSETGLPPSELTRVPYFPVEKEGFGFMYGINADQAAFLRDKSELARYIEDKHGILSALAESHRVYGNVVLPHERADEPQYISTAVKSRLAQIQQMYADVAQVAPDFHYPTGVVIQDLGGDGGFGTMILLQSEQTQEWVIKVAGEEDRVFTTVDEALGAIENATHDFQSSYKVARFVDTSDSPSQHVYSRGKRVIAMPRTYQYMSERACVGGGSANSVDERPADKGAHSSVTSPVATQQYEGLMKNVSEYMMSDTAPNGDQAGMVCFDFIVSGELENRLREVIKAYPDLDKKYAQETFELAIVECNARHTSLSGASWPAITAIVHRRASVYRAEHPDEEMPRGLDRVSYEDIQTMYGEPNSKGEVGAFFTLDKAILPLEIRDEADLVRYLRNFNARFEDLGIFMLPRLRVHAFGDTRKTSVIVGIHPHNIAENPTRMKTYKDIVRHMKDTCSIIFN